MFRVAILIVGFRNPQDVCACLTALSHLTAEPEFEVFVCENGGIKSFIRLVDALTDALGPCDDIAATNDAPAFLIPPPKDRLVEVKGLILKDRQSRVWVARADQNLGYAGGVNAWIDRLLLVDGWNGVWILNPDCEPQPDALRALVERAIEGNKGMVGSTIVPSANPNYVHCRGGHRWRKFRTGNAIIGYGDSINAPISLSTIEGTLDCISGASMYVTRSCLETIGTMDERFFLYYEDADWSMRAKSHGLGYAQGSIVRHVGGTTIGSAPLRSRRSQLSVYLESRNRIHFIRIYWRRFLPLGYVIGLVYAFTYLFAGSPKNFSAALYGMVAGMRGKTGQPQVVHRLVQMRPYSSEDQAASSSPETIRS